MGHGADPLPRPRVPTPLWTLSTLLGAFLWCAACGWLVRQGWASNSLAEQLLFSAGLLGTLLAFLAALRWRVRTASWAWTFMAGLVVGFAAG